MTLSGQSDREQRRQAARAVRQEGAAAGAERRPWLIPLVIVIALAVLAFGVTIAVVNGEFF